MVTIRQWLKELGLEEYAEILEAEKVDVESLSYIREDNLEKLGIPLGPRLKILATVSTGSQAQNTESPDVASLPSTAPETKPPAPIAEAEHRQLTVMFCDLVGSTELSTRFDPEVLREIMGAYQTAAGAVIDSYDGHVAQYLGDGLMVYFGWPHAHEDDAVRAVQAGLEVIEGVKRLDVPTELSVRVGIATGPVVVGETGDGDPSVPKTAVGETPNLAARVQGMAEPNTLAIGGITRGLIGSTFELEGLGTHTLKGIADPVKLFRVLGDKGAESRFEATYADHLTPVVGRDSEIALQLDRWQRANDGEGQVILLSGEPGIGKSRLIHMLREKLSEDTYTPIRYQCSTHHSNSAFYPAINQLERAAGFAREDSNEAKLDKLETLLQQSTGDVANVARLFASLLSLPTDRYPSIEATPQQLKEQTISALNDQLLGLATTNPVVFLIEDVQWCDPTTLELIGDAITRIIDARVLLVITHRPEFEAPWTGHAHVSVQTLNRLSRREGSEVVEKVTGGKSLPKEVLDLIVAKTDGIPLYVEELTKNVLGAGFLKDAGDHYELDGPLPALAIPTTLQESLIARLDRLNTVKTIAQIGACIGREFTHELVSTVSPLSDSELQASFQQLIESQIILPQGRASHGSYIFKHALLQDAAYASLLKGPKRQFHDLIAEGLKAKFPEVVVNTPELLASHLAKAEKFSEAIDHWKEAGLKAKNASSNQEAASHFEMALKHLEREAPSPARNKQELKLQAPLAIVMTALHGWSSPKAGSVYERAFSLSQKVDNPPEIFQVMYGLSSNRGLGTRFVEGLTIAKQMANYADTANDKAGYVVAHRFYGTLCIFLPDFAKGKAHIQKATAVYEKMGPHSFEEEYGHDPKGYGLGMSAMASVLMGFPDQGIALIEEEISHANALNSTSLICDAGWTAATIFRILRDPKRTKNHADTALGIAQEEGFTFLEDVSLSSCMWAEHHLENPDPPTRIEPTVDALKRARSDVFFLWLITSHIDVLIREQRTNEAREIIRDSVSMSERAGCKWFLPELLRLDAECSLKESNSNVAEVETIFLESIELARTQKAKLWELRTAVSLAQFLGDRQEQQKAYDLLFPVYDWYTEGFDTADLREAKELLEQLQ